MVADQRCEFLGGQREPIVFAQLDRHRLGADVGDVALVQRVAWRRVDDFVATLAIGLLGEADRRPRAGVDHHPFRVDVGQAAVGSDLARQGLAQFGQTLRIAISGLAGADRRDHRVGDVFGQGKIRLAKVAADDPLAVVLFDGQDA